MKPLPTPPISDRSIVSPEGRTLNDAPERVTPPFSSAFTVLKPLPSPPSDASSDMKGSRASSPFNSPAPPLPKHPEVLHSRGIEAKGYPVRASKIPTLVKRTDTIKSQRASIIKDNLRVLPGAESLIMGTGESSKASTMTSTTPLNRGMWPPRDSSLPRPGPSRVSTNGSPVARVGGRMSYIQSLRTIQSESALPTDTARTSMLMNEGSASLFSLRRSNMALDKAYVAAMSGMQIAPSNLLPLPSPNFTIALQIAEEMLQSATTPFEKADGQKYLLATQAMHQALECANEVRLANAQIEELVKMNVHTEHMMNIHLKYAVEQMRKEPAKLLSRFASRIPVMKTFSKKK